MANAAVEKLKSFGLHHGEKVGVGLSATLLVAFVGMAITRPTLDLQPEQLSKAAESAEANINQRQKEEDILAKLEESGLKNPGFLAMVENQKTNALKPEDFRARLEWVTPEPGAGLIRDTPELVEPREVAAFPGRGGILMYALDDKGEKIIDEEATKAAGQMAMGEGGIGGPADTKQQEEARKQREAEAKRLSKSLVGAKNINKAKEKEEEEKKAALVAESVAPQQKYKEVTKGQRWVVITGVLDNKQLKENWATALKLPPQSAYPNYKEIDLERQQQLPDGGWSDWTAVDKAKNYQVLDNIPEVDAELVPDTRRLEALVDPLPFLRAGYWTAVHVAKLVPAEARELPKTQPGMMMGGGMMGGMEGGMMGGGMIGSEMMGSGGMEGGMEGGMMGGMEGGMMGSGQPVEDMNFAKSEEPELMTRSLDFTVEPDTTYRYRARVVVVNPNKNHTDVNPGVDTESDVLRGPWSEPTDEVTVPADVAAYAQAPVSMNRRDDRVAFQVVRWDPESGQTVVKNDDAGPGEIVGEFGTAQVPSSDGTGASSKNIDFNAYRILLDSIGGRQLLPPIFPERNQFETPAVAMVVRPDGAVVVRRQSRDKADEVRADMENNWKQAIQDSGRKRDPNMMMGEEGGFQP